MNIKKQKILFIGFGLVFLIAFTGIIIFAAVGENEKAAVSVEPSSNESISLQDLIGGAKVEACSSEEIKKFNELLKLQKEIETGKLQVEFFKKMNEKLGDKEEEKETLWQAFLKAPREFSEKIFYGLIHHWPTVLITVYGLYFLESKTGIPSFLLGKLFEHDKIPVVYGKDGAEFKGCEIKKGYMNDGFKCESYHPVEKSWCYKNCSGKLNNGNFNVSRCETLVTQKSGEAPHIPSSPSYKNTAHKCSFREKTWGQLIKEPLTGGTAICYDKK